MSPRSMVRGALAVLLLLGLVSLVAPPVGTSEAVGSTSSESAVGSTVIRVDDTAATVTVSGAAQTVAVTVPAVSFTEDASRPTGGCASRCSSPTRP